MDCKNSGDCLGAGRPYYGNLAAEMARSRITDFQLAASIGLSVWSIRKKKCGEVDWKRVEMLKIQHDHFPGCTLEYLFTPTDPSTQ